MHNRKARMDMKRTAWEWAVRSGVPRGEVGVFNPPPTKFRRPSKIVPNSARLWKLLKIAEFRTPTPQDIQKKGSKFLKLPPVRNCFTLAVTNKLIVIINILKVPKIKKILLYEMKFLVPNYSCLQNPWLPPPRSPFSLSSVLKWICWTPLPPEQNSWSRHWLSEKQIWSSRKTKGLKKMFAEGMMRTEMHSEEDVVTKTGNWNEHYKAVCLLSCGEYTHE